MKRTVSYHVLCLFIIAAFLAACTPEASLLSDPDRGPTTCSPAELIAPVPGEPMENAMVGSLSTFTWTYSIYCDPDRIAIKVVPYDSAFPIAMGEVSGTATSWTPDVDLGEAGSFY